VIVPTTGVRSAVRVIDDDEERTVLPNCGAYFVWREPWSIIIESFYLFEQCLCGSLSISAK
jgi:hypothetical protein